MSPPAVHKKGLDVDDSRLSDLLVHQMALMVDDNSITTRLVIHIVKLTRWEGG